MFVDGGAVGFLESLGSRYRPWWCIERQVVRGDLTVNCRTTEQAHVRALRARLLNREPPVPAFYTPSDIYLVLQLRCEKRTIIVEHWPYLFAKLVLLVY